MPQCLQQYLKSFFNVTTLLILTPLTQNVSGEYLCEFFVLFHREENKQVAEEIHSFPSLKHSRHKIVWKQHTTFLNPARDDSKRYMYTATKAFFALKGRTDITWNMPDCYRPLRIDCGIARMHESELENGLYHALNARGNASYMLCSTTRKGTQRSLIIVYEMYHLPKI